jgi:hypothetical protein
MAGISGSSFSHSASVKSDGYAFRVLDMRFSLSFLLGFSTLLSLLYRLIPKSKHTLIDIGQYMRYGIENKVPPL